MDIKINQIGNLLRDQIKNIDNNVDVNEVGEVLEIGDGVARTSGLGNVMSSELVEFPNNVFGMALNLEEENQIQDLEELMMFFDEIGIILVDNIGSILLFLGVQVFLGIVLMFAPFAASLENQDAIQALRYSIMTALPNFFNILFAYLIIGLAVGMYTYLLLLLGTPGTIILLVSFFIGLFVVIPVLNLIAYDMFTQLKDD